MAKDTTTSLASFFKTKFRHKLGVDLPKASLLARDIDKNARSVEVGGTSLNTTWTNISAEGVGTGALDEGADYPTPLTQTPLQYSLGLAHLAFSVGFTGHTEAMGTSQDMSWIGSVAKYLEKRLRNYAKVTYARFCVNDGTPNWGVTTGAASGTTNGYFTVGFPANFVRKGELLTVRDAASGGSETVADGTVVEVDAPNSRIYCADVTGVGSGEYVSLAGYYGKTVPNGIRNIVGATGSIQGVTRTTVGNFMTKAVVISSTGKPVTGTSVDELRDMVETEGGIREDGSYTSKWYANQKYRRWATLASAGQARFAGMGSLQLGAASIDVADRDGYKTINEDQYIEDGTLYAVSAKDLIKVAPQGMKGGYPIMNGNSILFRANASSGQGHADEQRIYWVIRGNLGCDSFRSQGKDTGRVSP